MGKTIRKSFFSVHVDDNNIHNLEPMWISPDVCQRAADTSPVQ